MDDKVSSILSETHNKIKMAIRAWFYIKLE
jgi:hypothetical protein